MDILDKQDESPAQAEQLDKDQQVAVAEARTEKKTSAVMARHMESAVRAARCKGVKSVALCSLFWGLVTMIVAELPASAKNCWSSF